MKKASKIARAKRTRLGRILCRLAGDEAGAVMMEYVVLALLVCAAVVGIVMVFGDSISGMFKATTQTLQGDGGGAAAAGTRQTQVTDNEKNLDRAANESKGIIYGDGSGVATGTGTDTGNGNGTGTTN